jgi:hypothetical protein
MVPFLATLHFERLTLNLQKTVDGGFRDSDVFARPDRLRLSAASEAMKNRHGVHVTLGFSEIRLTAPEDRHACLPCPMCLADGDCFVVAV